MAMGPGALGQSPDLTTLISTLQTTNQVLTRNGQYLASLVAAFPNGASYTVATLPATAANGASAFASNGRKPGEGAGAGTGVPVFFNSATGTWFSYCSGALVTT